MKQEDATSGNRVICHAEKIEKRAGQGRRAISLTEGGEAEDRKERDKAEEVGHRRRGQSGRARSVTEDSTEEQRTEQGRGHPGLGTLRCSSSVLGSGATVVLLHLAKNQSRIISGTLLYHR